MASGHPKPGPTGAGADGGPVKVPDTQGSPEPDQPAPISATRITARRDFLAANSGVRVPSSAFVLLVKPTGRSESRAGFTVSKKIGNAVARNRARRRLREATRIAMADAAIGGADHVFIARRTSEERPFADLVRDACHALAKARRKLAGTPPSRP